MRADLRHLIDRIVTKEARVDSSQSTAWHAYREAEQLSDDSLLDDLQTLLANSKSKDERSAAYFILGTIGANTGATKCAQLLVDRIPAEQDKYVLSTLLGALSKITKSDDLSLAPVFLLLRDPRWLVRQSAIESLKNTTSPEVEERLLSHLCVTTDSDDIVYCHSTLNNMGTLRSLAQLTLGLSSRKRDVKMSAQEAIRSIQSRHQNAGESDA